MYSAHRHYYTEMTQSKAKKLCPSIKLCTLIKALLRRYPDSKSVVLPSAPLCVWEKYCFRGVATKRQRTVLETDAWRARYLKEVLAITPF